jgi:hypothetical protein
MTKIKDYLRDAVIHTQDKVIGTDFSCNFTKNYTISDLSAYFSEVILDSGSTNVNGNLTVQQDQADATITVISDSSNVSPGGEQHNPSIHFIQDGGAQNAAIGFNIIDDTGGGTIPGTGNRFWIINAMDDDLGAGGITFGTINQDGWQNAVARFMIRGDGKGLFGHPNANYTGSFDSMFEVYDDRSENTTTDYSLTVQGVVDTTAPYTPARGAGGIVSRIKAIDNGVNYYNAAIGLVPGTNSSEIITSEPLAFYANSDMDTSSATGFSGNVGTNGKWNFGSSFVATPASTVTVSGDAEVVGSANGVILESPNGTRYRITVDDSGNLTTTAL